VLDSWLSSTGGQGGRQRRRSHRMAHQVTDVGRSRHQRGCDAADNSEKHSAHPDPDPQQDLGPHADETAAQRRAPTRIVDAPTMEEYGGLRVISVFLSGERPDVGGQVESADRGQVLDAVAFTPDSR
jgi:hypothetical protein